MPCTVAKNISRLPLFKWQQPNFKTVSKPENALRGVYGKYHSVDKYKSYHAIWNIPSNVYMLLFLFVSYGQ